MGGGAALEAGGWGLDKRLGGGLKFFGRKKGDPQPATTQSCRQPLAGAGGCDGGRTGGAAFGGILRQERGKLANFWARKVGGPGGGRTFRGGAAAAGKDFGGLMGGARTLRGPLGDFWAGRGGADDGCWWFWEGGFGGGRQPFFADPPASGTFRPFRA